MDKGFIKLSRKFFSDDMWNEARTFSSCEAWLDLIQSARFEATPRKESIGGREVSYNRGQCPASIRYLSKRWKWTERKVRSFISHLKKEGMVTVDSTHGISIITLCKYDEYNSYDTASDTASDTAIEKEIKELRELLTQQMTQQTTQQTTQPPKKRHTGDANNKKEKEESKESPNVDKKSEAKAATLARKGVFGKSLIPFVGKYGKDMIRAFFDYWSELNKSETKMRFELEKTWEVAKRLSTWANREKTTKKSEIGIVLKDNSTSKYDNDEKWNR